MILGIHRIHKYKNPSTGEYLSIPSGVYEEKFKLKFYRHLASAVAKWRTGFCTF
jgi:hypothetical protein